MKVFSIVCLFLCSFAFIMATVTPVRADILSRDLTKITISSSDDSLTRALDAVIGEVYSIVSGAAGQERNWKRFSALFHPSAHMTSIRRRGVDTVSVRVMTVQEFIERADVSSRRWGFIEQEIERRVEMFGDLAQVWSVYQVSAEGPNGHRTWKGINSFQLFRDGAEYRILSIAWEDEAAGLLIPGASGK